MSKATQQLTKELGAKIRQLRSENNVKLVEFSKMSGLSASMISQVERGIIAPSIETLKSIADTLGVSIGDLFSENGNPDNVVMPAVHTSANVSPVVHEFQRKTLSPGKGITFYLLNPNMDGPIEFIYNVYEPKATTGEGLYSHPGHECGLILEGQLEVQVDDTVYLLNKGDSITFDSSRPHAKRNTSNEPCLCVWANNPPWF